MRNYFASAHTNNNHITRILVKLRNSIQDKGLVWTVNRGSNYLWQHLTGKTPALNGIHIDITTYCNLKCPGCLRTLQYHGNSWKNRHMSIHDFRKIVKEIPTANEIVTQGVGEPTLHPDLPELIRIAKLSRKFNFITITSNATARKDLEYYSQLFDAGLTTMFISVDSLDPVLANELRTGGSTDELSGRIRLLASHFPGKIAIGTVVGRKNIDSIPSLLAELNDIAKLNVFMHPYDDLGDNSGCLSLEERAAFEQQIPLISAPFRNLKIFTSHFTPSPSICRRPWRAPGITVDGYLTPCVRILNKDIFNFGNLISSTFTDVRNSSNTEEFLKEFLKKTPSICTGCPMYAPW